MHTLIPRSIITMQLQWIWAEGALVCDAVQLRKSDANHAMDYSEGERESPMMRYIQIIKYGKSSFYK